MARTKARINPGLAKRLAASVIRDTVESVAEEAKDRAQDAKRWQTTNGADARPSHRHADGQTIPATVPYQLPKMEYVREGGDQQIRRGSGQVGNAHRRGFGRQAT
jgi:hypothetical protein